MQKVRPTNILTLAFLCLLVLCWTESTVRATDDFAVKCPSPDGRFALRITNPQDANNLSYKVDLIERATGEVVMDLENAFEAHLADTILVWSSDSRRVAFSTRGTKVGETSIFFWNGSVFEEATLPDDLPEPKIHFGRDTGGVKNYGGVVKALRWLKSGELELSSDLTMMSRETSKSYMGVVVFTLRFDSHHRASVRRVGKTKTTIDG